MVPIEIRVVPRGPAWRVVSKAWHEERIDTLCTRDRAIEHARERAAEIRRSEPGPVLIQIENPIGHVEAVLAD